VARPGSLRLFAFSPRRSSIAAHVNHREKQNFCERDLPFRSRRNGNPTLSVGRDRFGTSRPASLPGLYPITRRTIIMPARPRNVAPLEEGPGRMRHGESFVPERNCARKRRAGLTGDFRVGRADLSRKGEPQRGPRHANRSNERANMRERERERERREIFRQKFCRSGGTRHECARGMMMLRESFRMPCFSQCRRFARRSIPNDRTIGLQLVGRSAEQEARSGRFKNFTIASYF